MLVLEALRAKHGDALILHFGTKAKPRLAVIDGGPAGVHNDALRPRLDEIRKERKLAADKPLDIDLMMVSHIDDDHITGLLELVAKMKDAADSGQFVPWRISRFWHNAFDDITGNTEIAAVKTSSVASVPGLSIPGSQILASVAQGRTLRNLLQFFNLAGNGTFKGLVMAGKSPVKIGDLKLTVVAPDKERLDALQKKWDKDITPILKKEKATPAELVQVAAFLDDSVHNLSSIVVFVEAGTKRLLLTGDGRGDHTLDGIKAAKLLDAKGKLKVDVLKVPHHGSDRNVDRIYFETIIAKHYIISADGKYDNPDIETLRMISAARPDDKFTIHLTYPTNQFSAAKIGKRVAKFFKSENDNNRTYKVHFRKPDDRSLRIPLAP